MSTIATTTDAAVRPHLRYVRKETLIAIAINCLFSAAFVFIVFGRHTQITLWGPRGLALDFVPQTFIISLMTVTVATLLTRKRVRHGQVPAIADRRTRLPHNVLLRAVVVAAGATLICGGVATIVLAAVWSGPYVFNAVLALKVAYGAIVAAVVARIALRAALSDETETTVLLH